MGVADFVGKKAETLPDTCESATHNFLPVVARWWWYEPINDKVWTLCDECARFVMDSPTSHPVMPIPGRGRK